MSIVSIEGLEINIQEGNKPTWLKEEIRKSKRKLKRTKGKHWGTENQRDTQHAQ